MEPTNIVYLILLAIVVAFLFQGSLIDAMRELVDRFRGGPPTPRHPLAADDGNVLRRKRSERKASFSRYA